MIQPQDITTDYHRLKEINSIQEGAVFDEITHNKYSLKYGIMFEAGIGAESIYEICRRIDLKKLMIHI